MSKICQLTGKRPITGNNVSHSNRKTRRRFEPNLIKKTFFIPETGDTVTLKISNYALRSVNKLGVYEFIQKMDRKGLYTGPKLSK